MKMDFSNVNNALALRSDVEPTAPMGKKLGDVYEEFQKLVFLFDTSGSMNWQIASGYEDQYQWPPEKMAELRARAEKAWADREAAGANDDPLSASFSTLGANPVDVALADLCDDTGKCVCPDEDIQRLVIRQNFLSELGIDVNWVKHTEKPLTRLQVVKKLAHQELRKRIEKFPQGGLAVIEFGHLAVTLADLSSAGGSAEDRWGIIEKGLARLNCGDAGGGTDILNALTAALDLCRANPSKVNLHHFILVTDGEDFNADRSVVSWIPTLKQSGVVLDYIHIGDGCTNTGLKRACRETGGEYALVNSEKMLSEKFVAAATRLCLPPARE